VYEPASGRKIVIALPWRMQPYTGDVKYLVRLVFPGSAFFKRITNLFFTKLSVSTRKTSNLQLRFSSETKNKNILHQFQLITARHLQYFILITSTYRHQVHK
jgi:hypothetical protein